MDMSTSRTLVELNNRFYRENSDSFSRTRNSSWPGWDRAFTAIDAPRSVLDVACGNLRFKSFLDERYGRSSCNYFAVDSCMQLVPTARGVSFQLLDILDTLLCGEDVSTALQAPACELVVCFGFMHHVPSQAARLSFLDALLNKTVPNGHLVVSFWQFERDSRMIAKARATTEKGMAQLRIQLDEGDYLMGWNDTPGVYRYCHSFTDEEIQTCIRHLQGKAVVQDRFRADGRTGDLNTYLVLEANSMREVV